MTVLDDAHARKLEALCEAIVPGSARVGPVVYIDALLAPMPQPVRDQALASIDALDPERLAEQERTPEFAFVRALAIEAFYSDFVEPGREATGAWAEIDFAPPAAQRLRKDWSWLGIE
ncbi:MAG TPA: hypothetical protein VH760_06950 [Gaiellaceae bacterium]|jgi:hypothetical protein